MAKRNEKNQVESNEQVEQVEQNDLHRVMVEEDLGQVGRYDHLQGKSAKIRAMYADGYDRATIAKQLGIRYQHVRNVLVTRLTSK